MVRTPTTANKRNVSTDGTRPAAGGSGAWYLRDRRRCRRCGGCRRPGVLAFRKQGIALASERGAIGFEILTDPIGAQPFAVQHFESGTRCSEILAERLGFFAQGGQLALEVGLPLRKLGLAPVVVLDIEGKPVPANP